jgi:hypothetical protein
MSTRAISRLSHPVTFLVAVAAIYACSILIVSKLSRIQDANAVAVGVTCDLVLLVPALYYLLLVRGRHWPAIGLVPVFIIGLLAASWILPADHQDLLTGFEWAAVPMELGLLGYIGWRAAASIRGVRRRLREGHADAFTAIRGAARETIGSPLVADVLAQELAMFWYAFCSWRSPLPRAGDGFTSYRKNNYGVFLFAIVMVLVIETLAVHLLVHTLWSGAVAWILTGVSLYALLWMIGDWQALRLRTTIVTPERIHIRLGTRWEVEIPRASVLYLGPPKHTDVVARPLKLGLLGDPNVEIRLSGPVTARGMYGLRRTSSIVRLQVDDPETLSWELKNEPTTATRTSAAASTSSI